MNRFDCIAFDCEQRTDEWHALRKGKLTGSAVGDWLADEFKVRLKIEDIRHIAAEANIEALKKCRHPELVALVESHGIELPREQTQKAKDSMQTAINRCLGDLAQLSGPPSYEIDPNDPPPLNPSQWAIWNGLRLEDEARQALERRKGFEIEQIGFMLDRGKAAGCSPDGLVKGRKEGVEIKCPLAATHVGYLRKGELPDTYAAQVHFCMAVTGADAWHFWSYCPGLPPFYFLQRRDDTTERMRDGINRFTEDLDQARQEMAELWEESENASVEAQPKPENHE